VVLGGPEDATAETKAVAFLAREVPQWSRENRCFSCHNNGDAAKALILAARSGFQVPPEALHDSLGWLLEPKRWDHNGGEGPSTDKRLARLVFTATLATAAEGAEVEKRRALVLALARAAERLASDQAPDGSWPLEGEDSVSAPATYGRPLATLLARQALFSAGPERFGKAIESADRWLLKQEITTVTGASVSLMIAAVSQPKNAPTLREQALALLRRAQGDDGGWGPRVVAPSECFDTALALLALRACPRSDDTRRMIDRGRAFLIREQRGDGSWVETTRPPGNTSYAQQISTCGWATMALLATRAHPGALNNELLGGRAGADRKR
jgi:hypothetical protein